MAKNETDSGLFVALNHFSHLTLCLSEKMRRCFKRSDIFEKTSDFFRSLAVTDFTTLESGLPIRNIFQTQNVVADIVTIPLGKDIGLGRSVVEKKVSESEEIEGDMGVQCVYGGSDKC